MPLSGPNATNADGVDITVHTAGQRQIALALPKRRARQVQRGER